MKGLKLKKKTKINQSTKQIFKEFKRSLKHLVFDETLTLYILRPIAFIFVKLLYPTNITPNQVSLASIVVGVVSGFFFSRGTHTSFIIAGSLYFFCLVLDCVDGMIARLKKSSSAMGRIIDGVADHIVGLSVYIGMGIGFGKAGFDFPISYVWMLAIAAVSHIFHSMIVDYYRVQFMSYGLGKVTSTKDERAQFTNALDKIKDKPGHWLDKILISLYLGYAHLQLFREDKQEMYDKKTYLHANKLMIKLWFWIGPTAHIFVLIIAAILFRPIIFFIYTIGVANIYMIILWIIQVRINKRIALSAEIVG